MLTKHKLNVKHSFEACITLVYRAAPMNGLLFIELK